MESESEGQVEETGLTELDSLVVNCERPQPVRRVERPLEQARVLEEEEVDEHAQGGTGPFTPGLRIGCPLRTFALRKAEHCKKCVFLEGIAERIIHGGSGDDNDPKFAATKFLINCGHPTARSLQYFPED